MFNLILELISFPEISFFVLILIFLKLARLVAAFPVSWGLSLFNVKVFIMSVSVLVGVQWGDEGKGKIIDVLTKDAGMVVRFQGGNNAGHTVENGKEHFVLHLIPSGILRQGVPCVIANGVVVDPVELVKEMNMLTARGVDVSGIQLGTRCQLIMPWHKLIDAFREDNAKGEKKIGTTKRGIGPAYCSKAERTGIRGIEMADAARFEKRFREEADAYNKMYVPFGGEKLDVEAAWKEVSAAADVLRPYLTDTVVTVNEANRKGVHVLLEGAQGAFLDIDHGTYPYVTSSNTTSGGACTGTGLAPRTISCVWGVLKAYSTRVGEGPFPTELDNAEGEFLRQKGGEFGATTGRPRRCGWLDAVSCRHSCLVNGVDYLAITKLDVLDDLDEIKICTAYRIGDKVVTDFPEDVYDLNRVEPVYETMPGWKTSTTGVLAWNDLPENAQKYLLRIAELVDSKIGIVSVGPDRAQTFRV